MSIADSKWHGIVLALAAAALFGASTPFAKLLLGAIDPWMLAGLLYLGSGAGLAAIIGLRRIADRRQREASLTRADVPWLAGAIVSGGILGPILLMVGLRTTDAAAAALLLNLEGLATIGIAWLVYREHLDRRLLVGGAAILAGAMVLSWQGGTMAWSVGASAIAGACLAWGLDNNLTRKISTSDPLQITALKGLAAGTVSVALALVNGAEVPAGRFVAAAGLVGFFGYGLSLSLFVYALRYLGAARTGAYFSTAPFVGALLAVVMLAEPITLQIALAALLMGFGVWLHISERHEHDHVHEPLAHEHAHTHDDHHRHSHEPGEASAGEPHSHWHEHGRMVHRHPHYPDPHHRHSHRH